MSEPLESRYDHAGEDAIYRAWEESGYFNPDACIKDAITPADAEPYSIVLPPPNVTGTLHMGHAAMLAIEDILVRYYRMNGRRTLWVPGTDSAAIATQAKVENEIYKKDGQNRHDLGREELLKRIEKFTDESKATIINQTKKMGSSLDWSRYAFTLDDKRYRAVMEAFTQMHGLGLIERDYRVVNWDPKGQTTISDDEIVYEERRAKLYTFKYSKDFPIAIATTRPETKLGDTGVAVNPDDGRYQKFIGQEYDLNFCGTSLHIKIVGDPEVDPEFGTGAVGVTPAHSMTDAEIARRHNLPTRQVINEYARIMDGAFKDKKVAEAREAIVSRLQEQGLLEKEEEVTQSVATAERTGGVIEPLPKLQWFVRVNKEFVISHSKITGIDSGSKTTLKEIMKKSVESGQIKIMPERFERVYFNWIDNLRDWCISRQIWYGHRIPVWYQGSEIKVSADSPGNGWEQDPDTLDTWFSSGLWTMSTLGWPEETEDFKTYHPTSLLETGYDIIFFWVARMILMTGCLAGDIPFKQVYLHGLVRDAKGKKMSKSLGNIMDPLDLISKYGADATRLSLIIGAGPGNDIKLSEDRVRGYRNFSTKIWNIARFIEMNKPAEIRPAAAKTEAQENYLKEIAELKKEISAHIEALELHLAAEKLYHYAWHRLADEILEAEKNALKSEDADQKSAAYETLSALLLESLIMLHPFMPFVTEAVYQKIKKSPLPTGRQAPQGDSSKDFLMVRRWNQ